MDYTYKSETIADTIAKLNSIYFIPAIQRPYVWEAEQIEKLFDSLMKEYPISTFLVWQPPAGNKNNWHTYRFVQHFKYGEIHNEEADLAQSPDVHLVLDGQQRLTSLYIGLNGSYRIRPKYKRKYSENSYIRQKLYLNLLKNPEDGESADEEVEGVTYGFQFHAEAVRNSSTQYWYPVAEILDINNFDKLEDRVDSLSEALDKFGVSSETNKIARKNLKRLHKVIWDDKTISICTVKQPTYDKVLDIFVRANDGGTKLSKSDLLMSLVTLNWRNFDARDELIRLLNEINLGLSSQNDFDRDFILRSALLFSGQKYVFKVDSFTRENLAHIEANWLHVKAALPRAISLVNSFGISNSKGNLTSNNSIMPIAYYVFNLQKKHESQDVIDTLLLQNKRKIRIWLVSALFSGVFAGAADSTVVKATRILREQIESGNDFPAYELAMGLSHRRKNALFDEERIEEFLMLSGKDRVHRICLQMLYEHDEWERDSRKREYIFAPSTAETLVGYKFDDEDEVHRISNMVFLDEEELSELKVLGSEEWLATRNPAQRVWHTLPDQKQCDFGDFGSVIAARKKLISDRLTSILLPKQEAYLSLDG
jgi:uncharacterized protein with ParB-like and HNH nuclease domain